jgi:hypothetical protein
MFAVFRPIRSLSRQNWLAAYDFTTDKGAVALNHYARANDPFTKVGKIQVAVSTSLLPMQPNTVPFRPPEAALRLYRAWKRATLAGIASGWSGAKAVVRAS